jgi:hypothetical protein
MCSAVSRSPLVKETQKEAQNAGAQEREALAEREREALARPRHTDGLVARIQ